MRIIKEDAVFLIIDVQEKLFPHMFDRPAFLERLRILIQGMNILEVPVIVTEQYRKGLGETILQVRELVQNTTPAEKISFSCCDESKVMAMIMKLNRKFVVVAGIESHVCVLQTVIDLAESGFIPVVVADCVTSRRESDKSIAIERIRAEGAVVTTSESILLELCRVAGNEKFKALSALIK